MHTNDGPVIVFNDDLIFNSKIRSDLASKNREVRTARTEEKLLSHIPEEGGFFLIVNLNMTSADPFSAIGHAQSSGRCAAIYAFFSHVDAELGARAVSMGVENTMPRSAFVRILPELFL